jgi:hypothetical protein
LMLDFVSHATAAATKSIPETTLLVKSQRKTLNGHRFFKRLQNFRIFYASSEKYGHHPIEAWGSGVRLVLERMLAILSDAVNNNDIFTKVL